MPRISRTGSRQRALAPVLIAGLLTACTAPPATGRSASPALWPPRPYSEQDLALNLPALRFQTAGHVGCRPEEIEIVAPEQNDDYFAWTAKCHGRTYVCSRQFGGTDVTGLLQVTYPSCSESAEAAK